MPRRYSLTAGKVLLEARAEMERQEAPHPMWFYLTPGDR